MTESEWLACEDPKVMLTRPGRKLSGRKVRLFSCACCHRVWNVVRDERLKRALDNLERYADDSRLDGRRIEAGKLAAAFRQQHYDEVGKEEEISIAVELWSAAEKTIWRVAAASGQGAAAAFAWADVSEFDTRQRRERKNQALLLRDIFGNPFRPITFSPSWRTHAAVTLARTVYESRDFGPVPILADALQDAGCADEDILNHCRAADGVYVRGCWVIDLLLGKS
jgi:hypothetical protein